MSENDYKKQEKFSSCSFFNKGHANIWPVGPGKCHIFFVRNEKKNNVSYYVIRIIRVGAGPDQLELSRLDCKLNRV